MDVIIKKKIAEAKQHVSDAEKSMKTSLFKRKPDLESAAIFYAQAGSCYRIAKEFKQAIECCQKAAQLYTQNNGLFSAAKQYEQIGLMANEIKDYSLLFDSYKNAAENMITSGTRDSAGIILERGANMLKQTCPEKSLQLYQRAIQIAEVEEKFHEMVSFYENMVLLALRSNQFDEAISIINEAFKTLDRVGSSEQYTRYINTVIILYLSRDDWVGAKSFLESVRNKYNMHSNTATRMDDLLQAYDEKDDAKFKELIKNYLTHAVDNEALKIAQTILKSEEWLKAQEDIKYKSTNSGTNSFPTVQKYENEQLRPINVADLKISDLNIEPDGSEIAEEDHHHREKQRNQLEEDNKDEKVTEDHKIGFEPDGTEFSDEDHHKDKILSKINKEHDSEDEFADGIL